MRYATFKDYSRARCAHARDYVTMYEVLDHYGIEGVEARWTGREIQYSCPLHGDGQDSSPSARVYPDGGGTFCFACDKARDIFRWVQDYERCSFWEALQKVERVFHVPPFPGFYEGDEEDAENPRGASFVKELDEILHGGEAPPTVDWAGIATGMGRMMTRHHDQLKPDQVLKLWYAFDVTRYSWERGDLELDEVRMRLQKIRTSLDRVLRAEGV